MSPTFMTTLVERPFYMALTLSIPVIIKCTTAACHFIDYFGFILMDCGLANNSIMRGNMALLIERGLENILVVCSMLALHFVNCLDFSLIDWDIANVMQHGLL